MSDAVEMNLRFFAGVREKLACAEQRVVLPPEIKTVGGVRDWLVARGGVWAVALAADKPLRMAYQHVMCDASEPLLVTDQLQEIAFFPPVTGG
jgi:molybdopterin synthase sulfur carrier subunit